MGGNVRRRVREGSSESTSSPSPNLVPAPPEDPVNEGDAGHVTYTPLMDDEYVISPRIDSIVEGALGLLEPIQGWVKPIAKGFLPAYWCSGIGVYTYLSGRTGPEAVLLSAAVGAAIPLAHQCFGKERVDNFSREVKGIIVGGVAVAASHYLQAGRFTNMHQRNAALLCESDSYYCR